MSGIPTETSGQTDLSMEVDEATSTRYRDMAEFILQTMPEHPQADSRPYLCSLSDVRSLLLDYLQAQLQFLHTNNMAEKPRLRALKQGYQATLKTLLTQIADAKRTTLSQMIACDESGEPQIFMALNLQAVKIIEQARQVDAINYKLQYLCVEKAKLETPTEIHLTQRGNTFTIQVPNIALGYTVHNLLLISNQIQDETFVGAPYDGKTVFELSDQEVTHLNRYLSDLYDWYHDFELILSSLFGENAAPYTATGQKPVSEIVKIENGRQRATPPLAPLITPRTVAQFLTLPQQTPVLLIGQVALDLRAHPEKDALKTLIEAIYQDHRLPDSKGDPKTFIRNAGYEYISLLSIPQIETILEDLMANGIMSFKAREMGYPSHVSSTFLADICEGRPNPNHVYAQILQAQLMELPLIPDYDVNHLRKTQLRHEAGLFTPRVAAQIMPIQQAFETHRDKMLDQFSGVSISVQRQERDSQGLSETDMRSLLPPERPSGAPLYPTTAAEIDYLLIQLKSCSAYQDVLPLFEAYRQTVSDAVPIPPIEGLLDKIAAEFKTRITRAPMRSGPYYGAEPLALAQTAFMAFVTRVYHAEACQLDPSSILAAFKKMAEIQVGSDLEMGCERGFAGRMTEILTTLTRADTDPLAAALQQLKKEIADRVFVSTIARGSESSMAYLYKHGLYAALGIQQNSQTRSEFPTPPDYLLNQFFQAFARECKPSVIFNHCLTTCLDNFRAFARDDNDEAIYALFESLGFTADRTTLDLEYRIDREDATSKWNFSKIKFDLTHHLIEALVKKYKILDPGLPTKQLAVPAIHGQFSAVPQPETVSRHRPPPIVPGYSHIPPNSWGAVRVNPPAQPAASGRYNVYASPQPATASASANRDTTSVRDVSASALAKKPAPTSSA